MDVQAPLFDTKAARKRLLFKLYALSIFIAITLIFYYRLTHFPDVAALQNDGGHVRRLSWIGLSLSELWFGLYKLLTVFVKWNPVYRRTYKDRLSHRYETVLPEIDIFVCTADPELEPPVMVVNTVLSLMAYNYPPEKLNVYVSDDGCSDMTFYALLEAVRFSEEWLPFCRKFKVEPGSPEAYFRAAAAQPPLDDNAEGPSQWVGVGIKKLYEEMKNRLEATAKLGRIPEETRKEHEGFLEWNRVSNKRDHPSIVKVLINGRDPNSKAVDRVGQHLPTLVYLAREKSPRFHHNFKAGAMNALLRVSSTISNALIILNVDCDMYSNNRDSIRDALCFFMDENNSHNIAFVQYPQKFDNLTRNDLYGSALSVIHKLELHAFDNNGGPLYIGTGCFHRREVLSWRKCSEDCKIDCRWGQPIMVEADHLSVVEETCRSLASCSYEQDTQWGKEMGLMYGCPVEDVITGLAIQCRGWRSIYFNPEREAFLGLAPVTLLQALVQHKRWSEGDFQIFLSKYCPLLYGHNKIPLKHQLSYCPYLLWAANCLPTLYYATVPSLCLLRSISLFPKISSIWFVPFMYLILATCIYNVGEFMWCGGTFRGFWNDQRMWLFKRTTSYLFGFLDDILKVIGFDKSAFAITTKVADNDVCQRFEQEIMEFGATSAMFTILTTIAMLNFVCLIGGIKETVKHSEFLVQQAMQMILCGLLVCINWLVYEGMFFRKDRGSMPSSVTIKSIVFASVACSLAHM